MKQIGGSFATLDNFLFIKDRPSEDQELSYFPSIKKKCKAYFETGADALAAILNEVSEKLQDFDVWFPENYCQHTIERVRIKSTGTYTIKYFGGNGEFDAVQSRDRASVFVFVHFNAYDKRIVKLIEMVRSAYNSVTVEDFVHAPFEIGLHYADYAFNSMRKIASIDVGVCYRNKEYHNPHSESEYFLLRRRAADLKSKYLITGESHLEEVYLELYQKAEQSLNSETIYPAQSSEIDKLSELDFDKILKKRRDNYACLSALIDKRTPVKVLSGDYMFLMLEVPERDALRKELFDNQIYAPVHWADSGSSISESILSLPIDQRYDTNDMKRIAASVNSFFA
jgi:hypothetical protein